MKKRIYKLPQILDEHCEHCQQKGNWQVMMDEIICSDCLNPWVGTKRRYYTLIISLSVLLFWFGVYIILT